MRARASSEWRWARRAWNDYLQIDDITEADNRFDLGPHGDYLREVALETGREPYVNIVDDDENVIKFSGDPHTMYYEKACESYEWWRRYNADALHPALHKKQREIVRALNKELRRGKRTGPRYYRSWQDNYRKNDAPELLPEAGSGFGEPFDEGED